MQIDRNRSGIQEPELLVMDVATSEDQYENHNRHRIIPYIKR